MTSNEMDIFASQDLHIQYHTIVIRTKSNRDSEWTQMDVLENELVSVYPPTGAAILVQADAEPVQVVVDSNYTVTSSPELAHMDRSWNGLITLQDDAFDVGTFDDLVPELMEIPVAKAGEQRLAVEWRYTALPPAGRYDPAWKETVILRFGPSGQA